MGISCAGAGLCRSRVASLPASSCHSILFHCPFFPCNLHLGDRIPLAALMSPIASLLLPSWPHSPKTHGQGLHFKPNVAFRKYFGFINPDELHQIAPGLPEHLTLDVRVRLLVWDPLPRIPLLLAILGGGNPLHYEPEWGPPAAPGGLPGH